MKGIILAGGSGTRLYPLTKITSKQLLPVYDKPMVYYPLSVLMWFGIREVLIISTPKDLPSIKELFGDGSRLGMKLSYAEQPEPKGIAQAFTIGADFIGNDRVALILGDNIFYFGDHGGALRASIDDPEKADHASIFAYHVADPERFGVVEFDKDGKALSIEEKPAKPRSNYAIVGLYFYPADVVKKAAALVPSARGEYEITDINEQYLKEGRANVVPMRRGSAWLDAGTPDSLMEASSFVQIMEKRQGLKIACIEEIAYENGFIGKEGLQNIIDSLKKGAYRSYLEAVLKEKEDAE